MSHTPMLGKKTAILVANGFSEQDLIKTQKCVQALGGDTRIVSMNQGLVNSWNGTEWGLNFAADQSLNTALAVDYDAIIIPGGQRSMDKLKLTGHTRRFINGFLDSGKPVVAVNEAVDILEFTELLGGRNIAGESNSCVVDGNLFTCVLQAEEDAEVLEGLASFFISGVIEDDTRTEAVAA